MRSVSPEVSILRLTCCSLTKVPFVLSRSSTSRRSFVLMSRQCKRDTRAQSSVKSAVGARPIVFIAPGVTRKVAGVVVVISDSNSTLTFSNEVEIVQKGLSLVKK